eukprot:5303003-Prymnesium_polylepis.1
MRTSDVSTTLTLGRNARSRPNPLPALEGRSNLQNRSIEARLYATHDRVRVRHAWQQALDAAKCTDAHVGRLQQR